ncbi:MAG: hypothetical protein GY729_04775 [Desulfobacteraceae bacterium]|nr:hypothetical protein [Desulfobacteraceae bacterium]
MASSDQNNQMTKQDLIFIFLLLLAGIILFPLKGVAPSPDSSWYLNNALAIYNDFGFDSLMIRRPLVPFLISICFHLFGNTIESAFFVVRFFFILNLLLAYYSGLKLFNRSTGIAFSLLLLSSFVINKWSSYLLLDAIVPFFILLYILVLYQAFENKSTIFFALSGFILGLTFLLKGVFSIFFMFLPLFLLIQKKYRTTGQIKNILVSYLIAIVVLLPWLGYCIWHQDFFIIIGPLADSKEVKASGIIPLTDGSGFSLWIFIRKQLNDFIHFFNVYIGKIFILSNLFILAIIYCLCQLANQKNRASLLCLFFTMILFSPVVYIGMKSGGINFRNGQFMVLYFLFYLMTAFMVANFSGAIAALFFKGRSKNKIKITLFTVLILTCLFFQIFAGPDEKNRYRFYTLTQKTKIRNFYGFSFWQGKFNEKDGWAGNATRDAGNWIEENIPKKETILCQWYYLYMLDYLTDNQYDFQFVSYTFYHDDARKKPLFIWPRYNYKVLESNSLVALFENNLLAQVNENKINYLVVTHRRNFLALYLKEHPDFELAYSITHKKKNIKIFKTRRFPVSPLPQFSTKFHEDMFRFFRHAAQKNKPVFHFLKNEMQRITHWDEDQLQAFIRLIDSGNPEQFRQTYDMVKPRTPY